LPRTQWATAYDNACRVNPDNLPEGVAADVDVNERLALDVTRYWGKQGVKLTVGFIDTPDAELRTRILSHMNAWSATANVTFVFSEVDPQVRIARFTADEAPGHDGYWSYVGTDVLLIAKDKPTMNLEAFTMQTSESEFHRVVRHEAGHTCGFPHEHMRKQIIERLDPDKVIASFMESQGWSEQEVRDQILTPLEDASILGTTSADQTSIMCYQIDGSLTKDGKAIVGGLDINDSDRAFAALVYPKPKA
jgi:hypothetical protein